MPKPSKHILVVDDDRLIQETLRLYLERAGYRVAIARNGNQAIKYIDLSMPDVIILDILMPDMDGLEMLRHLQQSPCNARVLVMTPSPLQVSRN